MELTPQQKLIMQGKVCPYCGGNSELISSEEIYKQDYGMMWICRPCDAYVGCHKWTETALGRLANKSLRELKKDAHMYFDQIWQGKIMSRTEAYMWLSESLNIPAKYTHIGMFSEDTCISVILLSQKVLRENKSLQSINQ